MNDLETLDNVSTAVIVSIGLVAFDKTGIKDIYETLDAIYLDTRDERYKICSLLKTKYLKGETFY